MTTPTEELAKQTGGVDAHVFINTFRSGEAYILTPEELQAFREAVEAECEAERMKQPMLGYLHWEQGRVMPEFHYKQSSHEGMQAVYAKPFPSTEQLQKEVDDLASKACDQCDGDGWNYNAVEGQVPCVCMTEAEPYQQLQQRVKELEDAFYVNMLRAFPEKSHDEIKAEIARITTTSHSEALDKVVREAVAAKQAEIDRLMLEYCPDKMTEAQTISWAKCQRHYEFGEQK